MFLDMYVMFYLNLYYMYITSFKYNNENNLTK